MRKQPSGYGLGPTEISRVLKQYAIEGFGYASYPMTTPGIGDSYGISLSSLCRVYGEIEKMPAMQLLNYTEQGWDDHQDVVTLLRVE
jgi:hypothetical protein